MGKEPGWLLCPGGASVPDRIHLSASFPSPSLSLHLRTPQHFLITATGARMLPYTCLSPGPAYCIGSIGRTLDFKKEEEVTVEVEDRNNDHPSGKKALVIFFLTSSKMSEITVFYGV